MACREDTARWKRLRAAYNLHLKNGGEEFSIEQEDLDFIASRDALLIASIQKRFPVQEYQADAAVFAPSDDDDEDESDEESEVSPQQSHRLASVSNAGPPPLKKKCRN